MKNAKYVCGKLFLGVLLISQIISCGGGGDDAPAGISYTPDTPFIASDLAGTWYIFGTNGASTGGTAAENIAEGYLSGTLILNSSGQVAGGSYTRSNGETTAITGGLINIDSGGALSGSFTTNMGVNFYLGSGKMDASKIILSFDDRTNYGEFDLVNAMRAGGGFAQSDLAGTWHLSSASGDYAEMTISETAVGTYEINSPGGGFITLDGSGLLTGNGFVTTNGGAVLYFTKGKISSSKDTMYFTTRTISGKFDLVTAILDGGAFTPSDLAGTWYLNGVSSSGASEATMSGTVILDSSGQVTGGSYTRSDGGTASFTGGTVTIDSAGALSGNATTDIGENITLAAGKMHLAKGMMSLVGGTTSGALDFLVLLKSS